jgi:hypothetical protein
VYLGRALIGQHGLKVVGVPDHRIFQRDSVGAQQCSALPRNFDGLAHVVELADAHLLGPDAAVVLEPAKVQRKQLRLA